MKITKYGHSCVLLDDGQTKILFDPGVYSDISSITGKVDGIIITHNHPDHLDVEKIKPLLELQDIKIITNSEVKTELTQFGIESEVLEQGGSTTLGSFNLEAMGNEHAVIHHTLSVAQNTGYIINGSIFHPGDALTQPLNKQIEILFLPIFAPWSKISETLDYLETIKPKVCFPIHDGFLMGGGAFYRFGEMWCKKIGSEFVSPELNTIYDL